MRHLSFGQQESARRSALEGHDAVRYASLCDDAGIPEHSIEDWELYERGQDLIAIGKAFPSQALGSVEGFANDADISPYAELTRIAFYRLPPDVSDRGLRRRASQINRVGAAVGYHLRPYSGMKRDELFSYLTGEVHREVAGFAREHCPNVLDGVCGWNAGMKQLEVLGK